MSPPRRPAVAFAGWSWCDWVAYATGGVVGAIRGHTGPITVYGAARLVPRWRFRALQAVAGGIRNLQFIASPKNVYSQLRPLSLSRQRCIWVGCCLTLAAISLTEKPNLLSQKTLDNMMCRRRFL